VSDRRTEILEAALRVLAKHGMRGLTHRAVDAAAGLPAGSTVYYFRSRAALVAGCVQRLVDVERERAAALSAPVYVDALVARLTAIGVRMVTADRALTLARYELSLAAARDDALRAALVRGGDAVRALLADSMERVGSPQPDLAAVEIAAALDGLVFTALLRGPSEPAELAAALRPALGRLLRAQPGVGS